MNINQTPTTTGEPTMSKYIEGVRTHWNVEWADVPAPDLADVIGEAMMAYCRDSDGFLDREMLVDMMHNMVQKREVLKECDGCSRLVPTDEAFCGDDGCQED